MCAVLRMGSHCTTCFTPPPLPSSSSTNLTPNEDVVNINNDAIHSPSKHTLQTETCDSEILPLPSLGDIHEEKEEKHTHATMIRPPEKIHVSPNYKGDFQRIEASQTVTPTANTTSPTMRSRVWTPANPPTTATSSEDVEAEDTEQRPLHEDNGGMKSTEPFNYILAAMKMKHNCNRNSDGHEYTKANSVETVTTCTSSRKVTLTEDRDCNELLQLDASISSASSDDDDDDTIPGPPPKLSLFNNSNRPPLAVRHANKRSSDSSNNGLSINIEHTQPRLSVTKTSITLTASRDTVDRLKIPNAISVSRSVSTSFDELGKKLNRMPTFQRALTSASITSLTSMHSQSMHLSFEKSLKLRDSAPSFHSMHSLRSLRTPTGHSIQSAPSLRPTHSVDNLYTHILYGHTTATATAKPHTPPVTHPPPSLDIMMPSHGRVSLTPSLPSISAKDVLVDMEPLKRFPSSQSSSNYKVNHKNNNVNPLDLVQKRVLFVSLVQLHRSYLNGIPPFVLEHAVFVFGIKRIWIFPRTMEEEHESKQSYIEHFRSSWSKEFVEMIANKDAKGHVLWIEPCHPSKAHLAWDVISNKLSKIVDLSVSEEETNRRKKEIELIQKQKAMAIANRRVANIEEEANETPDVNSKDMSCITDNEIVSRFPSDRTDSIPLDVPTMSYADTPMSSMFSKLNANNSSLQTIEDEEEKTQMSIAETLLKIHHSKQDALETDTFHTVYMDDDDGADGMHTDSDYDDTDDIQQPIKSQTDKPTDISVSDLKEDVHKAQDITPPSQHLEDQMQTRSTHRHLLRDKETKKVLKISIEDTSKYNVIKLDPDQYMPYYHKLKLQHVWWRTKYEPVRKEQSDQHKRALAESAKLISAKPLPHYPSPHHNESVNLTLLAPIKSLFNIEAEEVLKQLRCISTPNDIKLKPIKEIFYQSNPTLIPMEYFEWSKYMEYHMDPMHKYFDILQYCERFCLPNADLTPSASSRSHNSTNPSNSKSKSKSTKQTSQYALHSSTAPMEMLHDEEDEDDDEEDDDDDDGLKNAGFQMIDNISSNPICGHSNSNLGAIQEEVNVDNAGMVYMFDYDDTEEEYFDDEALLRYKPSIPFQTSIQSVKSDSALPFNGRLRGGGSESSVQLFD